MRFVWCEGQTTDKWVANLSVLACNLILLRLISAVTFGSFGSDSSQDNWFCIFTGLCRNALSRKSTSSVIHTVYWWTSVVIHRALCWILQPQRQNWVCSASTCVCSSNPYSRIRKPIQALQPHWCSFFSRSQPWLYFSFFHISSLTCFTFESSLSLPLSYSSLSLLWLQNVSFSIFRCSPLPFASLPLSSQLFSVLLKGCWAVGDSSVLPRWCFLISMMSDNSASGLCVQVCFL